jgi:Tfp pilus assembly protein PilX
MINFSPNFLMFSTRQKGAVTLFMTIILLVLSTLIVIYAARFGITQGQMISNLNRSTQAFEAADAGIEYAINYLQQNNAAILANPVSGFIPSYSDSNTTNVVLANNSRYTFTYANPVANNYNLIEITSTGTSDDNTATRVLKQRVQFGSSLVSAPNVPVTTKGSLSLGGSSTITNTYTNSTVQAGSTVSINGAGKTVLSSGISSTVVITRSDVSQNVSSISTQSQPDFFATYFGVSADTIKNTATNYFSNSTNTNYSSSLNGLQGKSIWIDQTGGSAIINGNTTIGSPTNPVLLIVNGNLDLAGTLTIYGFIYVNGTTTTDILGTVNITGAVISTGNLSISGNTSTVYNPDTLRNLQNQSSMRYYAKVAGSWRDF